MRQPARRSAGARAFRLPKASPRPAAGIAATMAAPRRLAYKAAMAPPAEPLGKLIFLVTEDWYFWSHRLPMARAARDAGFEVAVATRVDAHGERIRSEGFALLPLR